MVGKKVWIPLHINNVICEQWWRTWSCGEPDVWDGISLQIAARPAWRDWAVGKSGSADNCGGRSISRHVRGRFGRARRINSERWDEIGSMCGEHEAQRQQMTGGHAIAVQSKLKEELYEMRLVLFWNCRFFFWGGGAAWGRWDGRRQSFVWSWGCRRGGKGGGRSSNSQFMRVRPIASSNRFCSSLDLLAAYPPCKGRPFMPSPWRQQVCLPSRGGKRRYLRSKTSVCLSNIHKRATDNIHKGGRAKKQTKSDVSK
jgi:hypothetical protein